MGPGVDEAGNGESAASVRDNRRLPSYVENGGSGGSLSAGYPLERLHGIFEACRRIVCRTPPRPLGARS